MYRQKIDDLIGELQTSGSIPLSQQTFSTANLVQFADDALQTSIIPAIVSTREETCVVTYSTQIDSTNNTIAIPGVAAGFRVRDCYLYNPLGGNTDFNNQMTGQAIRINPDVLGESGIAGVGGPWNYWNTQVFPRYIIENNVLKFMNLQGSWIAKLRILMAPNHLVEYARCCGQIQSKGANNTVTVDQVPQGNNIPVNTGGWGDWTLKTGPNATTLDVLQPLSPFNFRISVTTGWALVNKSIIAVAGNTVTLDSDTYNSVEVGDFLVTNQCSPFIQYCPAEAYNLLKLRTLMTVLASQADLAAWSTAASTYNEARQRFLDLIQPKVENQRKKVGAGRMGLFGNRGFGFCR